MSTLVNQLTIEQAHKEYNSLVDKIVAKYQKFQAVGTPGFNAKSAKLASPIAHMSQLFGSEFVQYVGRQSYCVEDAALFKLKGYLPVYSEYIKGSQSSRMLMYGEMSAHFM